MAGRNRQQVSETTLTVALAAITEVLEGYIRGGIHEMIDLDPLFAARLELQGVGAVTDEAQPAKTRTTTKGARKRGLPVEAIPSAPA
jgi:hypothetical protein